MFTETLKQATADNVLFVDLLRQQGVLPGIKVDEVSITVGKYISCVRLWVNSHNVPT